jgi:predicted NBD/HSP70 family sugar kinase
VFAEEVAPTDRRGGTFVIEQIVELAWRAADQQGIPRETVKLAVVGVPGAPQAATGRVLLAPNIANFDAMDVVAAFEDAFGFDVMVENDVNLAVLGENWLGQGQGVDNLAFIAVGTGIGGGLILGGQLVRGAGNAAGELGFMAFGADPFDPESLRVGAFERVVASNGIMRRYHDLASVEASVPEIFDRADAGESHAMAVLDETARTLARGIATICAVANPQKIILGGSIGARIELIERVRAAFLLCFPSPVDIEAGALGARAAIVGAAAIGLSHLHNTLFGADAPDGTLSLPKANGIAFKEVLQ